MTDDGVEFLSPTPLQVYLAWIGLNAVGLGVGSLGFLKISGSPSLLQMVRGETLEAGIRDEYDLLGLAFFVFVFHAAQWLFYNSRASVAFSTISITAAAFFLVFLATLHFALPIGLILSAVSLFFWSLLSMIFPPAVAISVGGIFAVAGTSAIVVFVPAAVSTTLFLNLSRKSTSYPEKWPLVSGIGWVVLGAMAGFVSLASNPLLDLSLFSQSIIMAFVGAIYGAITVRFAVKINSRRELIISNKS